MQLDRPVYTIFGMSKTKGRTSEARKRIVETAERLFYADGVRAVGVDRVIAEAGVAKMTLYNHFHSKDDLILATLELRERNFVNWMEGRVARAAERGVPRLDAFFAALKEWFAGADFRGCSFINASVELADSTHPASRFAAEHKERLRDWIESAVQEQYGAKATSAVPAISLLVEGAVIAATMHDDPSAADTAHSAAKILAAKAKRGG